MREREGNRERERARSRLAAIWASAGASSSASRATMSCGHTQNKHTHFLTSAPLFIRESRTMSCMRVHARVRTKRARAQAQAQANTRVRVHAATMSCTRTFTQGFQSRNEIRAHAHTQFTARILQHGFYSKDFTAGIFAFRPSPGPAAAGCAVPSAARRRWAIGAGPSPGSFTVPRRVASSKKPAPHPPSAGGWGGEGPTQSSGGMIRCPPKPKCQGASPTPLPSYLLRNSDPARRSRPSRPWLVVYGLLVLVDGSGLRAGRDHWATGAGQSPGSFTGPRAGRAVGLLEEADHREAGGGRGQRGPKQTSKQAGGEVGACSKKPTPPPSAAAGPARQETEPARGARAPASRASSVDLPRPLGPSSWRVRV